jgi:alpha-L-arabinofuranosidase
MAVTKDKDYLFSCYLRSESSNASFTINIESKDGKLLASKTISGFAKDWKKFELILTPTETLTGARLVISTTKSGTYYLDMVSLFPKETWKNRPNGLRKDLMEKLADLKPAFVRFPGGCFVEGLGVKNSWQWKKTIGPVEQREGHWNIWGWQSTDGLGYFEYLQMCEDLGAEPLHVVNDGISHDINDPYNGKYEYVPMDKMNELVQDALDAIEYANGDVTTKWGAKRAEAGHPKPFNLKYIEVGNENHGPEYADRYPLFQDAIKAKYPEITVIMDTWGQDNYPKNRIPDMRDIHRFAEPYQFAVNYNQFDSYDRKGPKVYFGEWCANLEHPRKETLETGLYEGAFLTGLEKNSDHVLMQSYAPFMKNMGWKTGKPNMLNFDLDRVYGAPIYWIQKMYSDNRVDSLLKFEVSSPIVIQERAGTVGIGVQDTKAEFKDLNIESGKETFSLGVNLQKGDLKFMGTDAKTSLSNDNIFSFENKGTQSVRTKNDVFGANYTFSVMARKLSGKNGFRLFFNGNNYIDFGGDGNKSAKFGGEFFYKPGGLTPATKIENLTIEDNRWYEIKLVAKGYEIAAYLDGKLINQVSLLPVQSLYVSAGKTNANKDIVVKVINVSGKEQRTNIQFPGIKLESVGEVTVLTSKDKDEINSLENPTKVITQKTVFKGVSGNFEYVFLANSASVLRLKIKN